MCLMKDAFNKRAADMATLRAGLDSLGMNYMMATPGVCMVEGDMLNAMLVKVAQGMGRDAQSFIRVSGVDLDRPAGALELLLGARPGFQNAGDAKTLVELLQDKKPSFLFISCFGRAHESIASYLQKAFAEGKIVDHAGRTVSLAETPVLVEYERMPADLRGRVVDDIASRSGVLASPLKVRGPLRLKAQQSL